MTNLLATFRFFYYAIKHASIVCNQRHLALFSKRQPQNIFDFISYLIDSKILKINIHITKLTIK